MRYDGIRAESLMLLAENRFRNSRDFYEENKKKLKEGVTVPLHQIICALADTIGEIDDDIPIVPSKMVSRIRRDTRFTKDKLLYRDNLWTMFMRDKHNYPYYPCMWFEVTQCGYSGGVGTYYAPPRLMELFRQEIIARPDEFYDAVILAERSGAVFSCESYKKPKSGCPMPVLEKFFYAKNFFYVFSFPQLNDLENADFIEKIKPIYLSFKPLYRFILDVSKKYGQEKAQ